MTAPPAWTSEQRTAIERRAGPLLVDAAAGSGKTSVLVERFVAHVLEDGIEVGAILAITFTEKAAAELRDRIRSRLRDRGALEAARATEGAWISTIHGFCARMLRAGALAAGLDPAFSVLDSDQSEPLADSAFEAALRDLGRAEPTAVDLVSDFGAGSLRSAIRSVHAQLRSRGQRHPRLPAAPRPPGPETRVELADAAHALALELGAIDEPGARVVEALSRVERCLTMLDGSGDDPWAAELDALKLPSNGPVLSTDACVAYRETLAAHQAACATRAAIPVRALLDRLLAGFGERYEQAKREVSGVDFADLELLGRDLLRDHVQIRGQYAERFKRIMVDELQDTNRVQLELIESIARDNLFTVGDAQQSIYRFRHAEVSLFEERGTRLAVSGLRATLATNFRSRPEILTALNAAFAGELGERFRPLTAGRPANGAGPAIAAEPTAGGATSAAVADPRVELLLVDKGADWELEGLAAPWRLAEAEALAARIGRLVAAGTRPGDVVVLMRATTDMRAYERALERHGLPVYVIGGRGYWSHPQVLDLLAYLRVLANPRDEEALHTVLASPLVGASTDALVVLAGTARERGSDVWAVLRDSARAIDGLSEADRDALGVAAAWIPGERIRAQRGGIDTLVNRALVQTGYDLAMLAMPGGPRRLANVRKLMRLGREHEADHGPDLRGFLRIAAERAAGRAGSSREAEAPIEGEGLDAVRMMTIHRAKGLEFPVVCVADLGRSVRPPFELVRVSADGRLGLRLSRSGAPGRVSALDFDELGREEREAEEAEERRLFYVAMTRARERLVLSGATRFEGWAANGSKGGGSVAWIAPAFVPELGARIAAGGGDVTVGDAVVRLVLAEKPEVPAPAPEPGVAAPPAPAIAPSRPAAAPPSAAGASPVSRLSYSALGAYVRCGYRFYAERVLGLPSEDVLGRASEHGLDGTAAADPEPDGPGEESNPAARRGAADRGVLVHALLQGLSFRRPVTPDSAAVRELARRVGLDALPGEAEIEELRALVAAFAASDLRDRLSRATTARREERFAFPLSDGVLMTGAVDVLARERSGCLLVVDYKSDRLGAGEPAGVVERRYATQRLVYALAGLHTGARTVEVVHCFLERSESPVAARYELEDRPTLQTELQCLARGVMQGTFRVTDLPHRGVCAGCPAEGRLCSWPVEMTRRIAPDRLF